LSLYTNLIINRRECLVSWGCNLFTNKTITVVVYFSKIYYHTSFQYSLSVANVTSTSRVCASAILLCIVES
jgi:hypothetical protein